MPAVIRTNLSNQGHYGKVRDTYGIGTDHLLMIATDRISALDVVLPTAIPSKGIILNQLSAFWLRRSSSIVPNHLVAMADEVESFPPEVANHPVCRDLSPELRRRGMIVRRADRIDVECVARGYLAGSAWSDYQKTGSAFGISLPNGLREGEILPEPLFTPTTKAEEGHDLPMTYQEVAAMVGEEVAQSLRDLTLNLYQYAREFAVTRDIIIADTKFEFGFIDGKITVIDEVLTPDSSRFWDAKLYKPGQSQPNFDKQFVRDWLIDSKWDREPPAPELPANIVEHTNERYMLAYQRITGEELETDEP